MKNEDKIVELLSEMVQKQDVTNQELRSLGSRVGGLEKQMENVHLSIGELRLSVMKLADVIEHIPDHEKRISSLEKVVFKK